MMDKFYRIGVSLVSTLICCVIAYAQQPEYEAIPLSARDINNRGHYIADDGRIFMLPDTANTSHYTPFFSGTAINDNGRVSGYSVIWIPSYPNAVVGDVQYPGLNIFVTDISNSGYAVGEESDFTGQASEISPGGSITTLGYGGDRSRAYGNNELGVSVGSRSINRPDQCRVYSNPVMRLANGSVLQLPNLGGVYGELMAVNDSGTAVGYSGINVPAACTEENSIDRAFLFNAAGQVSMLPLPPSATNMFANDINNDEQVVGGFYTDSFDRKGFIYDPVHGVRLLTDLIDPSIGNVTNAFKINDCGQILVTVDTVDQFGASYLLVPRGSASVFHPDPITSSGDTTLSPASAPVALNFQRTCVRLPRLSLEGPDAGFLIGANAAIVPVLGRPLPAAYSPYQNFIYERDTNAFSETMAYYYVDSALQRILDTGIVTTSELNLPVRVKANDPTADSNRDGIFENNSYFDPSTRTVHFSDKGLDDAEDGQVVYHESMHIINSTLRPFLRDNAYGRAVDEGFSDYFAASSLAGSGPLGAEHARDPFIGSWFTRDTEPSGPRCNPNTDYLRNVANTKVYPQDFSSVNDSGHCNGEIISGVLWDLRQLWGSARTDRTMLRAVGLLPLNDRDFSDIEKFGEAVTTANRVEPSNSPPDENALRNILESRGIFTKLAALSLPHSSIIGGQSLTGTALLIRHAPSAGLIIKLRSARSDIVSVPATLEFTSRSTAADFAVVTQPVAAPVQVLITAAYRGIEVSIPLTVTP